jgi:AbrB family looped-hinge helix DNA binding protein
MAYRMGPKGQVVIPKEYRDRLGLRPGSSVAFRLRPADGVLELQPAWTDPIEEGPDVIQRLSAEPAGETSAADDLLRVRAEDEALWLDRLAKLSRRR